MTRNDRPVIAAAAALTELAGRASSAQERTELLRVAAGLQKQIPRLAEKVDKALKPQVLDRVQTIKLATDADDIPLAIDTGRLLLNSLPGFDDPKPKFP